MISDRGHRDHADAADPTRSSLDTPVGERSPDRATPTGLRGRCWLAGLAVAIAGSITAALLLVEGPGNPLPVPAPPGPATIQPVPARVVDTATLAALPRADTSTTLTGLPLDPTPAATPAGTVLHPVTTVPVYRAPGEAALAALPDRQLTSPTWVLVIDEQPGWVLVLLPSRPNRTVGWIALTDDIQLAHSPYRITVDRAARTLRLDHNNGSSRTWPVAVGAPASPTPQGRTFILASIQDTTPTFSPILLPLGLHSDIHTTYRGGPGTVAIHTWPTNTVFGTAASDGCIRVPPEALHILSTEVPLGTPVLIS